MDSIKGEQRHAVSPFCFHLRNGSKFGKIPGNGILEVVAKVSLICAVMEMSVHTPKTT